MHLDLGSWQGILVILGAVAVGLAKTGIPGIGILAVAVFALVLPARESTGALLPLLICADIVAVAAYRRHAVWSHLWRLMPWAAAGIIVGYFALGWINDRQVQKLIGGILITLVCLQYVRRKKAAAQPEPGEEADAYGRWFAITMGLLAGFTTMVSNAAGPIMILYLLAMRLPKMEFIGTAAWYFLILNLFKVPFSYDLGLISGRSLLFDAQLAPFALAGALCGRWVIRFIDQRLFENLALAFALLAGLKLVF